MAERSESAIEREFEAEAESYRTELIAYCYRMLGSSQGAEDMVQETMLRAWKGLDSFKGKASLRTWLYRIATNACLDALRVRKRRSLPQAVSPAADPNSPPPPPGPEGSWIEPIPDRLLPDPNPNPETNLLERESITLAFVAALQILPPRQRAVLILRDVLEWRTDEVAQLLGLTPSAVHSVLYRARKSLAEKSRTQRVAANPSRADELRLLDQYVRAWETADINALVGLLEKDAVFSMPPHPLWYAGRQAIRVGLEGSILAPQNRGIWKMAPAAANRQPAFGLYQKEHPNGASQAFALQVLTLSSSGKLVAIDVFLRPDLFERFGLPIARP